MASTQHVHQTLHPLARSRLDQRFIKHFDEVVQFVPAIEQSSEWHEGLRWAPSGYEGMASDAVVVKTTDIKRGNYEVRIYGPTHDEQGKLYPAFVYFHGGKSVEV
jgi:acetyl esterase/lipase